jgi:hypothetical protein
MNEQRTLAEDLPSPPPNYLVWAILSTILCCLPFGIVSIVYAAQVNSKWQVGDVTGANMASQNAKTWAWVSFVVGLFGILIWIMLMVLGIAGGLFLEAFS